MFTVEQRDALRESVLTLAEKDRRVVAGAAVGSLAVGGGDRFSDLDLTFAVAGEVYGSGSAEQQAVRGGWDGVGITVNPTFAKKLARPAKTAA